MKLSQWCFYLVIGLSLAGCEKYYLTVKREYVDRDQLASTYVGSPDPRQQNPPRGQELTMEWRLPVEAMEEPLTLVLSVLYRDYTQGTFCYPVDRRRGTVTYSLLGDEYTKTGGFLTYKAEIMTPNQWVVKQWKQVLWTELITLEEPEAQLD